MQNVIKLYFQGYTWDEYFYIIANKPGILVVYKGGLDCDGYVKMDEILYVDGAEKMSDLYLSERFIIIRKRISPRDRLFFSYAEMKGEGRKEVVACLNKRLNLIESNGLPNNSVQLLCEGAYALFPEELLSKES